MMDDIIGRHGFRAYTSYVAKVGCACFIEIHIMVPADFEIGGIATLDAIRREISTAMGDQGSYQWCTGLLCRSLSRLHVGRRATRRHASACAERSTGLHDPPRADLQGAAQPGRLGRRSGVDHADPLGPERLDPRGGIRRHPRQPRCAHRRGRQPPGAAVRRREGNDCTITGYRAPLGATDRCGSRSRSGKTLSNNSIESDEA